MTIPPRVVEVNRRFTNGQPNDQLDLRSVEELPGPYREVFEGRPYFNFLQSRVFNDIFSSDDGMIVSAPTGSGKTAVFEMAIIKMLINGNDGGNSKAVYLAPIKALCDERYTDWSQRFGRVNCTCCKLTGDTTNDEYAEIRTAGIIIATPEKWDSMTRRWKDNSNHVKTVRLFLVDEVHLIGDSSRGATMETVISRMKIIGKNMLEKDPRSPGIRFIAVTATLQNIEDFSEWFGNAKRPAVCHKLGEEIRTCHLQKVVLAYPNAGNSTTEFKFDMSLNYKLTDVIKRYSEGKPTLIFCSTRKSVTLAAQELKKSTLFSKELTLTHQQSLQRIANSVQDQKLREVLLAGVGFHHAGLSTHDRRNVEELFLQGSLPVLLCTSTLAMGVNLPAHLVIIKSTTHWAGGRCVEYSESDIMQMIGRAGRPQFDSSATAVIMTQNAKRLQYERQLNGLLMTESSLHKNLIDHVNAEISLHTFFDATTMFEWLKATFLFIRISKNPDHYGLPKGGDRLEWLGKLCTDSLLQLRSVGLIDGNSERFHATNKGKMMAKFYISFGTMKLFSEIVGHEDLQELLQILSRAQEFANDVQIRTSEKMALNTLNRNKNGPTIRYQMKGKIKTTEMKVNCLIQATLGNLVIGDLGLLMDVNKIFRSAKRIMSCLLTYIRSSSEQYAVNVSALMLAKCIDNRMWPDSEFISRQLLKIGQVHSCQLAAAGYTTFTELENGNPREIETVINRRAPFGNLLVDAIRHLPKYSIKVEQIPNQSTDTATIVLQMELINASLLQQTATAGPKHAVFVMVGNMENKLLCREKVTDYSLIANGSWSRQIQVTRCATGEELRVQVISEDLVGLDLATTFTPFYSGTTKMPVIVKNFIPQSKLKRKPKLRQTELKFPVKKRARTFDDYSSTIIDSPAESETEFDADFDMFNHSLNVDSTTLPDASNHTSAPAVTALAPRFSTFHQGRSSGGPETLQTKSGAWWDDGNTDLFDSIDVPAPSSSIPVRTPGFVSVRQPIQIPPSLPVINSLVPRLHSFQSSLALGTYAIRSEAVNPHNTFGTVGLTTSVRPSVRTNHSLPAATQTVVNAVRPRPSFGQTTLPVRPVVYPLAVSNSLNTLGTAQPGLTATLQRPSQSAGYSLLSAIPEDNCARLPITTYNAAAVVNAAQIRPSFDSRALPATARAMAIQTRAPFMPILLSQSFPVANSAFQNSRMGTPTVPGRPFPVSISRFPLSAPHSSAILSNNSRTPGSFTSGPTRVPLFRPGIAQNLVNRFRSN